MVRYFCLPMFSVCSACLLPQSLCCLFLSRVSGSLGGRGVCLRLSGLLSVFRPLSNFLAYLSRLPCLSLPSLPASLSLPPYFCRSGLSLPPSSPCLCHSAPLYPPPRLCFSFPSPSLFPSMPPSNHLSVAVFLSLPISLGLSLCSHSDPIAVGLLPIRPASLSTPFLPRLLSLPLHLLCPRYPPLLSLALWPSLCLALSVSGSPRARASLRLYYPDLSLSSLSLRLPFPVSPLLRVSLHLVPPVSVSPSLCLPLLCVSLRSRGLPGSARPLSRVRGRPEGPAGDARRRWPPRPSGPR